MRAGIVAASLSIVLAVACGRPPVPAPAAPGPDTAAGALASLERQEEGTRTLTAVFRLTAERDGKKVESTRGALVVARPDRLRLQLFSFGVMTVYDYTVRGERFRVRRPLEGETRTGRFSGAGPTDGEAPAYDLRPLFLRGADWSEAEVEERGGAWIVTLDQPAGRRVLRVSKEEGSVTSEILVVEGDPVLRARYADYRAVDGLRLPFRIEVEYPARGVKLEIHVSRYTRNEPVEESLFAF